MSLRSPAIRTEQRRKIQSNRLFLTCDEYIARFTTNGLISKFHMKMNEFSVQNAGRSYIFRLPW